MKHEKEIDQLLKDLFYHFWMQDWYYDNLIEEIMNELKISKEQLSKDIETGIKNGHSIESQLKIVILMFRRIIPPECLNDL